MTPLKYWAKSLAPLRTSSSKLISGPPGLRRCFSMYLE